MKKLLSLSALFVLLFSCSESKYEHIGQEIIDGKVSAIKEGNIGQYATFPTIWVQSPTETKEVDIPFEYAKRWKVGDTCLLIIEKYKVLEDGE